MLPECHTVQLSHLIGCHLDALAFQTNCDDVVRNFDILFIIISVVFTAESLFTGLVSINSIFRTIITVVIQRLP